MLRIKPLFTAILLSFFIYCEYFQITNYTINTLVGLTAIYLLFKLSKKELFITGCFSSIFWFWWVGYSFVYYELSYLIPLIIIGIGLIYGILFYILGYFTSVWLKVIYLFTLTFINPFSFNWFKLELIFINSYIGISKIEFLIILIVTAELIYFQNKKALIIYTTIIASLIIYNVTNTKEIQKPNLKIYLNETNIDQNLKWKSSYRNKILNDTLVSINKAIANKYDLIIFPETALPFVLNMNQQLQDILLEKSKYISIVIGSLHLKDDLYYNSSYLFENGTMRVANKVVLVPFGEAVPLPQKLKELINNIFYDGAKDYETALEATTFNIKDVKFRNAICYEATTDKIYDELDTNFVIAISNNAWFTPSIQPTLQKLLMKYYSKKYNLLIYNVTNKSKSGIISQ